MLFLDRSTAMKMFKKSFFILFCSLIFVHIKSIDDTNRQVLERAKEDGVRFIQLHFSDLHGSLKSVTITIKRLEDALEKGVWFDGSSIEGFTRIAESDMFLKPDPTTYALLPWETEKVARFICDIYKPDGFPFEGDPRKILKDALSEAKELGFVYNVGPEMEFFLFRAKEDGTITPEPSDFVGYFDFSPGDLASRVRRDIIIALEAMGLEVEMSHHEVAPGQNEINFKYGNALKQADRVITFKHVAKSIASKYGLYASFMPKPLYGVNGSGMHVHQSFFDIKTKKNAFFDPNGVYKLSTLANYFIAGQLKHAKSMSAILSPTVNSYKRLVPGYEAPVYICWGQRNRSALIRIPRYSPGREDSTRAELRCPDPSCNPYLAFAIMLQAGLDGIRNQLEPSLPVEDNIYTFDDEKLRQSNIEKLPGSLGHAISELEIDDVIKKALGKHTYPIYVAAKSAEYKDYIRQVTAWELDRYFLNT